MVHPILDSPVRRLVAIGEVIFIAIIQTFLLYGYGGTDLFVAALDSVVSISLLAVLVYLSWFIVNYVSILHVEVVTGMVGLSLWSAGCYVIQEVIFQMSDVSYISFWFTLPFRLSFAIPTWMAVMFWYRLQMVRTEVEQVEAALVEEKTQIEQRQVQEQPEEWIDRITIKDGSRIHLITIDNLLYIQACGDYVTLVTPEGEYVKEQTMKYLETHLPQSGFVRIHRSTIVNVTQISRVELYGKENYCLILKNGVKLRVSLSGYRLLKERLEL